MGKQGCVSCVEYLVKELGFDANSRRLKDKCTPLHIAYYNLHGAQLEKMSSALVAMKADTQLKNKWGETPSAGRSASPSTGASTSPPASTSTSAAPANSEQLKPAGPKSTFESPCHVGAFDFGSDISELVLDHPSASEATNVQHPLDGRVMPAVNNWIKQEGVLRASIFEMSAHSAIGAV